MSERHSISKEMLQDEDSRGLTAEHYKLIVNKANEAIVVAQDGKLKFANPKFEEITGFTRREVTDKPFDELIHPEDAQMVIERHRMRIAGEESPRVYSFRIVDKGGATRWVEINAVSFDWDGKPATLNFLNEITGRKQIESALKRSEERLRIAAECASGVMYEWEIKSDRLEWFGDIGGMLGLANGSFPMTTETWLARVHPEDRERIERDVAAYRFSAEPIRAEYRVRHENGQWLHWAVTGRVVFGDDGRAVRYIGAITDLTEAKGIWDEAKKRMEEIEKLNKLMIGRELRILEMKKELNELLGRLGEEPKYKV